MAKTEPVVGSRLGFAEWGAVLAGAVLAAALSVTLLSFGTAIGLSAASPWPHSGLSPKVIASLAVFWTMAQQIGSLMIGGYVAGRVRTRWSDSSHESEFRDGLHGGLAWAVSIIFGAFLVLAAAGVAANTGAELAGKAAPLMSVGDPMDSVLDAMLRPTATTEAAPVNASPSAAGANAPRARGANTGIPDETQSEMSRVLASSTATGTLTTESRAYLAQLITQRTGVSRQEAQTRVGTALDAAREAADKARRAAILTGFVTAADLSLGAAWWAALRGGKHRDGGIPARFVFGESPAHLRSIEE